MYKVENIITDEQRHQLLDVYHSLDPELAHQDYNLFDVDKRHPSKEQGELDCFAPLNEYAKDFKKTFRHYFLNYGCAYYFLLYQFLLRFGCFLMILYWY